VQSLTFVLKRLGKIKKKKLLGHTHFTIESFPLFNTGETEKNGTVNHRAVVKRKYFFFHFFPKEGKVEECGKNKTYH